MKYEYVALTENPKGRLAVLIHTSLSVIGYVSLHAAIIFTRIGLVLPSILGGIICSALSSLIIFGILFVTEMIRIKIVEFVNPNINHYTEEPTFFYNCQAQSYVTVFDHISNWYVGKINKKYPDTMPTHNKEYIDALNEIEQYLK